MLPDGWVLRDPRDDIERSLPRSSMGDLRELIADGEQPAVGTRFALVVVAGEAGEVQKVAEYVGASEPAEAAGDERTPLAAVPEPSPLDGGMDDKETYVKLHHAGAAISSVGENVAWLAVMLGAAKTETDYRSVLRDAADVIGAAGKLYSEISSYATDKFGHELAPMPEARSDFDGFSIDTGDRTYIVKIPVAGAGTLEFSVPRPPFPDESTQQAYESLVASLAAVVQDRIEDGDDPVEASKEERAVFLERVQEWQAAEAT